MSSILSAIFALGVMFVGILTLVVLLCLALGGDDGMPSPEDERIRQHCVDRIAELQDRRAEIRYEIMVCESKLDLADLGLPLDFHGDLL